MFRLFSERNKKPTDEIDVYIYDDIPTYFRNQLYYIIEDTVEDLNKSCWQHDMNVWTIIYEGFCKDKGLKEMDKNSGYINKQIENFIDKASTNDLLDFIDYAFSYFMYIAIKIKQVDPLSRINTDVKKAIEELNDRFQQHNLGYEFVNGELIRNDDKVIHHEYVKPALNLLHANGFKGAEEEYMKAFKALRNKDNKNAIIEAEKAFESTIKTICLKKRYRFHPEKDSARNLINILKDNGFFPSYLDYQLDSIVHLLESGAPVVRNKTSGHGQGEKVVNIPDTYAKYVIGTVAVNMVFLIQLFLGNQ